jgi:DNA-binding NarL/FixJ family response regulator
MTKISVAIIEDSDIMRELTARTISLSEEFEVSHTYANAEDAISFLHKNPPRLVLMDIHLPGMNGIQCITHLREICPYTQFMMFTVSEDDDDIFDALKAGATGYLIKGLSPGLLLTALRDLHEGGSPMSATIARRVVSAFHSPVVSARAGAAQELTDRERELLHLLGTGLRNKEIADNLYISLDTVKKHVNNIYRKLHVQSRAEALNKAFPK